MLGLLPLLLTWAIVYLVNRKIESKNYKNKKQLIYIKEMIESYDKNSLKEYNLEKTNLEKCFNNNLELKKDGFSNIKLIDFNEVINIFYEKNKFSQSDLMLRYDKITSEGGVEFLRYLGVLIIPMFSIKEILRLSTKTIDNSLLAVIILLSILAYIIVIYQIFIRRSFDDRNSNMKEKEIKLIKEKLEF